MVERMMEDNKVLAQLKASKSPKPGTLLTIDGTELAPIEVIGRQGDFYILQFEGGAAPEEVFVEHGHMPLPPYVDRPDESSDRKWCCCRANCRAAFR